MKNASIIGLGNIMKGDHGIGCYIVDALNQEPLGDSIEVFYLAEDSNYIDAYLYGTKLAIIVQAVSLGGEAGTIHCWNESVFRSHAEWLVDKSPSMTFLARALGRAALIDEFPEDLLFVWIEPKVTQGFGISPAMHKAMRNTIQIIRHNLFRRAFLPEAVFNCSHIHQIRVLQMTV